MFVVLHIQTLIKSLSVWGDTTPLILTTPMGTKLIYPAANRGSNIQPVPHIQLSRQVMYFPHRSFVVYSTWAQLNLFDILCIGTSSGGHEWLVSRYKDTNLFGQGLGNSSRLILVWVISMYVSWISVICTFLISRPASSLINRASGIHILFLINHYPHSTYVDYGEGFHSGHAGIDMPLRSETPKNEISR